MEREKLEGLLKDLYDEIESYESIRAISEQAQKDEKAALLRLNEFQGAVDDALLELRSSSPGGSAWGSGLKSKVEAPDLNPDPNGWKIKLEEIRAKADRPQDTGPGK